MKAELKKYFKQLELPEPGSHKGENGKLLIIGGSDLFHAASKWSLDIASKFVDMVFYSSVPTNNELVLEAKANFWNGIVVPREDVEGYLLEADAILIGPGMTRGSQSETQGVVDRLLSAYPHKKWVVDAGALQMVDPKLLNENCIITPHQEEMRRLKESIYPADLLNAGVTTLLKGEQDLIFDKSLGKEPLIISGGNPGMTKGGTGDVLAGLAAALYATQDKLVATVSASFANKMAGDELFKKVGPYFNASNLVEEVPKTLWKLLGELD